MQLSHRTQHNRGGTTTNSKHELRASQKSHHMMKNCITPEPTTQSTPLSFNQEEQPSAAAVVMTTPLPSPNRPMKKRPHIEACKSDDDKKSIIRPIMTTSSHKRRRRKEEPPTTVRFASVLHQTHVVPRWTTKDEAAASSWYSKHDIFVFQHQQSIDAAILRKLIQAAPTIDTLPQETAMYRGLERLLSSRIVYEISDRRKRCVMSVLVAQQRGLDMEFIAQVSIHFTEKAAAWALTLGSI